MQKLLLIGFLIPLFFVHPTPEAGLGAVQPTTFILVRHAEKADDGTSDPDLTAEGKARAERLVFHTKEMKIDAVYSTNFKRTRNTVAPLALAKSLTIELYSSLKLADLEAIAKKFTGGTVMIVGHSNTIPPIANTLLGREEFKTFADHDHGNLLIVTVSVVGKDASVLSLTY